MTENMPFDDNEPKYPNRVKGLELKGQIEMRFVYAGPVSINNNSVIMAGVYAGPETMMNGMLNVPDNTEAPDDEQTAKKFCRECGNPVPDNSKFCPSCGSLLKRDDNTSGGSYV